MRRHLFLWDGRPFVFHSGHEWYTKFSDGTQPHLGEITFLQRFINFTGLTVLDLGAHHGLYSRVFAILCGSSGGVVAIEPDPRAHLSLIRNCEENSRSKEEAAIFPLLVAIDNETTYRQFSFDLARTQTTGHVTVPTISTRCLQMLRPVDIMKVDIEGAESLVLNELPLATCLGFIVEIHVHLLDRDRVGEIVDGLRSLPHRLFTGTDQGWRSISPTDRSWMDTDKPFTVVGVHVSHQKHGL